MTTRLLEHDDFSFSKILLSKEVTDIIKQIVKESTKNCYSNCNSIRNSKEVFVADSLESHTIQTTGAKN
ncbi:MAG: hypothetical protein KC444_03175 [Nitrosopumilus sp.]|nr:hypothetical protein [Nitrosopumilus sp.]